MLDPGHGTDRDGDLLASPQMPLLEQHVGHAVVARIHQEALHLPDLTIQGMDVLAAANFCFTQRNHILDIGPRGVWYAHRGRHTADPRAAGTFK